MPRNRTNVRSKLARVAHAALLASIALAPVAILRAAVEQRVVAIADVHGDLQDFRSILRRAGVLDEGGAWIAGPAIVVQTGDLIDRGPEMRGVLDAAMALESTAAAGGGRYVQILGNHEVMNLVGDLRYVVPENYAEFADSRSEKRQAREWRKYSSWREARAAARGEAEISLGSEEKKAWLAAHPPGYFEHRDSFGPDGRYGRWLRALPSYFLLDRTLFVHGGIPVSRADSTLEEIDRQVHEEIARYDELHRELTAEGLLLSHFDLPESTLTLRAELAALDAAEAAARAAAEAEGRTFELPAAAVTRRQKIDRFLSWGEWSIFNDSGPLWNRDIARWDDDELARELPKLETAFGVDRFVLGHTPQSKGTVRKRADGTVFLIDTGMLSSYFPGGRGSALELVDGQVAAIYVDGERQTLLDRPDASGGRPKLDTPADDGKSDAEEETPPVDPASGSAAADKVEKTEKVAHERPKGFLGPEGKDLPFGGAEELLAFLRDAEVVEVKDIGEGITRPRRLTLERGGVRARAVFRNVSEEKKVANVGGGRRELNFRDYFGFEPAAYNLSELFDLGLVPPAGLRRFEGKNGSVQVWIEKSMTETRRREADTTPPDTLRWKRQLQAMLVWDALVGNTDRNQGNILFGPDWEIWLIDHTRAFRQSRDLTNEDKIIWCPRGLYAKLQSVSDAEIRAAVKGYLTPGEARGVIERRKKLVAHLQKLIAARQEGGVLFDEVL